MVKANQMYDAQHTASNPVRRVGSLVAQSIDVGRLSGSASQGQLGLKYLSIRQRSVTVRPTTTHSLRYLQALGVA